MRTTWLDTLLLAAMIALLAGCELGPGDEAAGGADGQRDRDAEVAFLPIDRSGVAGTVTADHDDDGATVRIELDGLRPGSAYEAQINSGRCAAGGPLLLPLGTITAESDGTGSLEREVQAGDLSPDEPAFVEVLDAAEDAVACADLEGHDAPDRPLTDRGDTAPVDTAASDTAPSDTAASDSL